MKKKREKTICFAYFGDGEFLGWYADSFGSIRKAQPKIYGNSESQIDTITKNFNYKMKDLANDSNLGDKVPALALVDNSLKGDSKILYPKKHVELRIVECPEYDGPNPDFDEDAYEKAVAEWRPSDRSSKKPEYNGWIYADYSKVKEWAENEPTEFIGKIEVIK